MIAHDQLVTQIAAMFDPALDPQAVDAALSDRQASFLQAHWDDLQSVEAVWAAMDREWDRLGAGYTADRADRLGEFYGSPVWLLNGLFTETDPESRGHREAVAQFIAQTGSDRIADFGGGFGALARTIRRLRPQAQVEVIEPFPSALGLAATDGTGVVYAPDLPDTCDVVVAQDVLEHVLDPFATFARLLAHVRTGGLVVTANCFQPMIKCHYPRSYHLHFTFRHIAPWLGCRFEGRVSGAPHAEIFRKTAAAPRPFMARALERASMIGEPLARMIQKWKQDGATAARP